MDRDVVFYAIESLENHPKFNRLAAVKDINSLGQADWIVQLDNMVIAALVDKKGSATEPTHLRFIRLRDDVPHQLSPARQLTQMQLSKDHKAAEFTHVVIWPDLSVGVRASRDAPRPRRLAEYFEQTSGEMCVIRQLFRSDVVSRLKALRKHGDLTKIQIKLRTSEVVDSELARNNKWFKSLLDAGKDVDAVTVAVTVSMDRKRNVGLSKTAGDTAQALALADVAEQLVVTGHDADGATVEINLKEQRIAATYPFDTSMTNAKAYKTIVAARKRVESARYGGHPLNRAVRG